jgi:membrane-associated protein
MTGLYALAVGSAASYAVALLVPALDVLLPVLPSEAVVIALGVATAGSTDPRIGVLVALAALGAFLGDNAAYLIGGRFGPAIERRLFAGDRGQRRRAWTERSLGRFGSRIIVACRFFPGGRSAVTLTCGLIGYPRRRFRIATAWAGILWASYAFFLGRLGGKVFEKKEWLGLLLALGLALAASALIEVARRLWEWRTRSVAGGAEEHRPGERERDAGEPDPGGPLALEEAAERDRGDGVERGDGGDDAERAAVRGGGVGEIPAGAGEGDEAELRHFGAPGQAAAKGSAGPGERGDPGGGRGTHVLDRRRPVGVEPPRRVQGGQHDPDRGGGRRARCRRPPRAATRPPRAG